MRLIVASDWSAAPRNLVSLIYGGLVYSDLVKLLDKKKYKWIKNIIVILIL